MIDVQTNVVVDAWRRDAVINYLDPTFRRLPGDWDRKIYRSSFEQTTLDETLAKLGVGHLYVCGAETDNCVRHTSHAALERGYDVTLVADADTTSDGPGRSGTLFASASVATTGEISF